MYPSCDRAPYTTVLTAAMRRVITIHSCMEVSQMRDLILQCAGASGILVALIHGVLGETKVFAKATIQPERLRSLIRLVWQAGTVAWIGGGVLLIAAPSLGSDSARHWIVLTVIAVYALACAANAWWSRGRGFGWKALGVVVALAAAGYFAALPRATHAPP